MEAGSSTSFAMDSGLGVQPLLGRDKDKEPMFDSDANAPLWGEEEIPSWAYEQESFEYFLSGHDAGWIDWNWIDMVSMKSWRYAFWANVLIWTFWAGFPVVGLTSARCEGVGLAESAHWLYVVYIPFLAGAIILELLCYRWFLPVLAYALPPWQLAGHKFSFHQYHTLALMLTVVGHLDLATSGQFLSKLLASAQCPHNEINGVWDYAIRASAVRFLPDLSTLAVLVWLAMLAQLLVGIGYGVPLKNKWNWAFTGDDIDLKTDVVTPFSDAEEQLACDALHALADSGRMNLILFRFISFKTEGRGEYPTIPPWQNLAHWRADRHTWKLSVRRMAIRVSVFLFLESSLQPNLQSSVLAINKAVTGSVSAMTSLSLFLSFFMAAYNLYMSGKQLWKMSSILESTTRGDDLQRESGDLLPEKEKESELQETLAHLQRSKGLFLLAATMSCLFLGYAFTKTIFAVFVCPRGVWNFPHCVDMAGFGLGNPQ